MQALIDALNAGGTWTWISFGVGALALITLVRAPFAAYRKGPAVLAAELGFLCMATAGVAWWQAHSTGDTAVRGAQAKLAPPIGREDGRGSPQSPLAAAVATEVSAEVARREAIPVRVGLGMGLPPLVLGGLLAALSGARSHGARR